MPLPSQNRNHTLENRRKTSRPRKFISQKVKLIYDPLLHVAWHHNSTTQSLCFKKKEHKRTFHSTCCCCCCVSVCVEMKNETKGQKVSNNKEEMERKKTFREKCFVIIIRSFSFLGFSSFGARKLRWLGGWSVEEQVLYKSEEESTVH